MGLCATANVDGGDFASNLVLDEHEIINVFLHHDFDCRAAVVVGESWVHQAAAGAAGAYEAIDGGVDRAVRGGGGTAGGARVRIRPFVTKES